MERRLLDEAELSSALAIISGWRAQGANIEREFSFADFDEAMRFVNAVADIARRMDHHPELFNVYNRVKLVMTTHDAGGVTGMDLQFASEVNALVG